MFIAEIGINHNGDINIAKELILMAKRCGFNVVKFQKRNVSENISKSDIGTFRKTLNGTEPYEKYKNDLEFNLEQYIEIDKFCKDIGISWTASVWDIESVNFISKFDIPFIKIPSARINEIDLLKEVNKTKKPVIFSTGMSDELEVKTAFKTLDNVVAIMYCKSSYPTPKEELNLSTINYLKYLYDKTIIGYSSHDIDINPILYASALGAEFIECHITLNKNMYGSDQSISFEENELKKMVEIVNCGKIWKGMPMIKCMPSEEKAKGKLRR